MVTAWLLVVLGNHALAQCPVSVLGETSWSWQGCHGLLHSLIDGFRSLRWSNWWRVALVL